VSVVTVTGAALLLALAVHASCGEESWGPGAPHPYCYSDLEPLYLGRGLEARALPYVEAPNEYPVLTGVVAYLTALPVRSPQAFFLLNALLLGSAALATSWLLWRLRGPRFAYFAAAPTLVLYAFLNWDLLPVLLATAGTYAFLRGRDRQAGFLLGLGAAAKLYPALVVPPFATARLREGRPGRGLSLLAASVASWAAVNVPVALLSLEGWSYFFRFSAERRPTWGTLWSVGCRVVWRTTWCPGTGTINALWPLAFAAVAGVTWWLARRRAPAFPRWTLGLPVLAALLLTSKVYSPQYSLWLLPWFALVLPDLRVFLAFEAADVLVFLTEFSAQGARFGLDPFPRWSLDVAVVLRALVLVAILVRFVRRPPDAELQATPLGSGPG
jgi:uncharacterized membrane protein